MSRGLGRVERLVLANLRDDWPKRLDVLAAATGCHPESVRRAMKTLADKGLAELGWDNGWRIVGGQASRMWDTANPTALLSADKQSALTPGGAA